MCKNEIYIHLLIEEFNKYKNYRVLKDIVNFTFEKASEDDIEYIKTQKHFLLQVYSYYIKDYPIVGRYHLGSFFQKLLNSKLYERLDYERCIQNIPKQFLENKALGILYNEYSIYLSKIDFYEQKLLKSQ